MDELLSPAAAPDESGAQFATVGEVLDDGVTLIFDGQDEATDKHYRCNASVLLLPGDRVKVCKDSGTYVVEYVVGSPSLRLLIPSGGASGQYLAKKGSDSYALKWVTGPTEHIPIGGTDGQYLAKSGTENYALKWVTGPTEHIPTGGTDGEYLVKNGTANYALKWASGPTEHIPTGGKDGQYLAKSGTENYALKWVTGPTEHIPTGGTDGQYLVKNGTANYALKWVTGPAERIPTGGTDGQYLVKNGTTNYALKWASAPVSNVLKEGNNNFLTLNSNRQLVPSGASSYIAYSLGSSSVPFWSAYFGGGTLSLGAKDAKIGFWGTTPIARCALSTTSQNMGYSSASASNYLTILNNIVGILKKYGLIT